MGRLCISLLFCGDGAYFPHMGAAVASTLQSNPPHDFRIFVCSEKREPQVEAKLSAVVRQFGNASITFLEFSLSNYCHLRTVDYLTVTAYMRLFLTEFLDPSIDRILYLDCDLIVCQDIAELWQTDLKGAPLAAAPEPHLVTAHQGFGPQDPYFNTGVLLVDVRRWRDEDVVPTFLRFAKDHPSCLSFADQDILNHVFRGRVQLLDYRWNFQCQFAFYPAETFGMSQREFRLVRKSPSIVHFSSKYKPWIYEYEPHYKELYTDALALTPWKDDRAPDRTFGTTIRRILRMKKLKERLAWYAPRTAFAREMWSRRKRGQ